MNANANVPVSIKPLHLYPQTPMDKEISSVLIRLLASKEVGSVIYSDLMEQKLFHFMVGVKRAEVWGIKVHKDVMVMIAVLASGPGAVVMYLHAIYQKQLELQERGEDREVDLTDMCHMFAAGFPDAQTMEQAWDVQKAPRHNYGGDNLIDIEHIFKARYIAPAQ